MTTYVVIENNAYPVDTQSQCASARQALRQAGLEQAEVWASPLSLEEIEEHGDPDGYPNGRRIFASQGRPPKDTGRVHLRLSPRAIAILDDLAPEHGSRSAAADALIRLGSESDAALTRGKQCDDGD